MLSSVKPFIDTAGRNFIGAFLYGSQNYGLDHAGSDVDAIAILRTAPQPKQEVITDSGKLKLYNLRYFIHRLRQGDLECYEILYTRYRIVNPLYEIVLTRFTETFSSCMSYERIRRALYRKLDEHLCHVLWMIHNDDGGRYNKKRLYWAMRVCDQLRRIDAGESFASSLIHRDGAGHDLVKVKTVTDHLSLKEFNAVYKDLCEYMRSGQSLFPGVSEKEEACLQDFYAAVTAIPNE